MKKYIILLIAYVSFLNSIAQTIVNLPQLGIFDEDINTSYYYKDANGDLNKFLGTWKYQGTNKELIISIHLKTNEYSDGMNNYYDGVYAKFKYTDNGTVIYNTLNDNSSASEKTISGSNLISNNLNLIKLIYREPTDLPFGAAKKYGILGLEYQPCTGLGCLPELKWNIFWTRNRDSDVWPFKIPKSLILTKAQ